MTAFDLIWLKKKATDIKSKRFVSGSEATLRFLVGMLDF